MRKQDGSMYSMPQKRRWGEGEQMIPFPNRKYNIIYADPPWSYRDKCNAGHRGACYKYQTMTLDEIKALPVADIAAENCLLAMWWVPPQPKEALEVVEAWGFTFKTMKGFTWHKLTKRGKSFSRWAATRGQIRKIAPQSLNPQGNRLLFGVYRSTVRERRRKPDEAEIAWLN